MSNDQHPLCCCIEIRDVIFKQKTAYEVRISDWGSDVCSSDLEEAASTPDRVDESGEPVQQLRIGRIERQPIEVSVEGGDTADRFGQKFLKQIVHCPDNPCHARLPIPRCILLEIGRAHV